jgi:hypothetical protein
MDLTRFVGDQVHIATELSSNYVAAACVRLHHAGHGSPVTWRVVSDDRSARYECAWEPPTVVHLNSYANSNECTDMAANAIALSGAAAHLQLIAVARCETGTGSDWFVLPRDAPAPDPVDLDFDRPDMLRIEISGIANDDGPTFNARLREKIRQVRKPGHPVPGIAGVAGFATLRLEFRRA